MEKLLQMNGEQKVPKLLLPAKDTLHPPKTAATRSKTHATIKGAPALADLFPNVRVAWQWEGTNHSVSYQNREEWAGVGLFGFARFLPKQPQRCVVLTFSVPIVGLYAPLQTLALAFRPTPKSPPQPPAPASPAPSTNVSHPHKRQQPASDNRTCKILESQYFLPPSKSSLETKNRAWLTLLPSFR